MGKVVTIQRTAAGQTTWEVEEDCVVTCVRVSTTCAVSRDPADTAALITTPAANKISYAAIASTAGTAPLPIPAVELKKGEKIFISLGGGGTCQLNIDGTSADFLA
jgi:hypothetical protein